MTTWEVSPEVEHAIVSTLAKGVRRIPEVAQRVKLPELVVTEIAGMYGYPHLGELAKSADKLWEALPESSRARATTAAFAAPQASARTVGPPAHSVSQIAAQPVPARPVDPAGLLLSLHKRAQPWPHLVRRVKAAGDLLERLQADVAAAEEKAAAKRAENAERDRLRREVKAAEAKLAELRAKLRAECAPSKPGAHPHGPKPENAAIRAWAERNGIECASRGYIARSVRAAYEAAQATP